MRKVVFKEKNRPYFYFAFLYIIVFFAEKTIKNTDYDTGFITGSGCH